MQITKGKIVTATKAVIYGPEGVGKSTLAAGLPSPLFIDVEGGTSRLDVARTPRPTSWPQFIEIMKSISKDSMGFSTVVIDTADWAEKLAITHVCNTNGYRGLGGNNDYGKSYNELAGMWADVLTMLEEDFIGRGINVVFLAHATTRKFELPEEEGQFDRYELSLEKKVSPLLKAWADLLLFCNYRTIVTVETDKNGKVTKAKGGGGTRRMCYAEHTASWDAKNRDGLPCEFDMEVEKILPCFKQSAGGTTEIPKAAAPSAPKLNGQRAILTGLMEMSGVTWPELLDVMVARGKVARDTTPENMNENLINQWIIPHWTKIVGMINEAKEPANV